MLALMKEMYVLNFPNISKLINLISQLTLPQITSKKEDEVISSRLKGAYVTNCLQIKIN